MKTCHKKQHIHYQTPCSHLETIPAKQNIHSDLSIFSFLCATVTNAFRSWSCCEVDLGFLEALMYLMSAITWPPELGCCPCKAEWRAISFCLLRTRTPLRITKLTIHTLGKWSVGGTGRSLILSVPVSRLVLVDSQLQWKDEQPCENINKITYFTKKLWDHNYFVPQVINKDIEKYWSLKKINTLHFKMKVSKAITLEHTESVCLWLCILLQWLGHISGQFHIRTAQTKPPRCYNSPCLCSWHQLFPNMKRVITNWRLDNCENWLFDLLPAIQ